MKLISQTQRQGKDQQRKCKKNCRVELWIEKTRAGIRNINCLKSKGLNTCKVNKKAFLKPDQVKRRRLKAFLKYKRDVFPATAELTNPLFQFFLFSLSLFCALKTEERKSEGAPCFKKSALFCYSSFSSEE